MYHYLQYSKGGFSHCPSNSHSEETNFSSLSAYNFISWFVLLLVLELNAGRVNGLLISVQADDYKAIP